MREIFYLTMMLFFLVSCNGEKKNEYYEDGSLKNEYYVNSKGKKDGEYKSFFPNGRLAFIQHWVNDTLNGEVVNYYLNGNVINKGYYKKGEPNDSFIFYYEDGRVRQRSFWVDGYTYGEVISFLPDSLGGGVEKEYFVNFQGNKTSLGWVSYLKNGKIYDESRRVQFNTSNKDTINWGESFEVELELRKPRFKKTEFVLGKYDDQFNLTDSIHLDTLLATGNKIKLKILPKERGINNIRGFARNYENIDDSLYQQVNLVYFEKKYFVR